MKLVEIVWEDAKCRTTGEWVEKQEWTYSPCICRSVGYVLYQGPEGYIITSAMHDEETAAVDQIPQGMILDVKVLSDASF